LAHSRKPTLLCPGVGLRNALAGTLLQFAYAHAPMRRQQQQRLALGMFVIDSKQ